MRVRERSILKKLESRQVLFCLGVSAIALCSLVPFSSEAWGAFNPTYRVGAEVDFSKPEVPPSTFPFIRAGIEAQSPIDESDEYEYKLDAELKISPTHPKAFTLSSRNFYYGEKDSSQETPLRFTFGRRVIGWSGLDEMWGIGAFEPMDSWDRLRSFSQGLTGVFGYTETQKFNFRVFLSYVYLPELTPNVVIEDQRFSAQHPQATSTGPQTLDLMQRTTPLYYALDIPGLDKILLRPSFAFMMETKREIPVYAKFVYGYMPLNYFPVKIYGKFNVNSFSTPLQLRPRLIHHHLYNGELAYRFSDSISLGVTGLIDQPIADAFGSDETAAPLTTTYNGSPWVQYALPKLKIILTHLLTTGGIDPDIGPNAGSGGKRNLVSSRILYRNATQLAFRFELGNENPHEPTLQLKAIREHAVEANWIAADFYYSFLPTLTGYIGGDVIYAEKSIASNGGAEFLSDMSAIDRIRVGVTYAF